MDFNSDNSCNRLSDNKTEDIKLEVGDEFKNNCNSIFMIVEKEDSEEGLFGESVSVDKTTDDKEHHLLMLNVDDYNSRLLNEGSACLTLNEIKTEHNASQLNRHKAVNFEISVKEEKLGDGLISEPDFMDTTSNIGEHMLVLNDVINQSEDVSSSKLTADYEIACVYCNKNCISFTIDFTFKAFCDKCYVILFEKGHKLLFDRISTCLTCVNGLHNHKNTFKHTCTRSDVYQCNYCKHSYKSKKQILSHFSNSLSTCKKSSDEMIHKPSASNAEGGNTSARLKTKQVKQVDNLFSQFSDLKQHKYIHTSARPYKCENCEKSFKQFGHLKQHENVHSGAKPHKCKYCRKPFSHLGSMKRHENIHTGTRPHKCKYCKKSFTQSSTMKLHENTHIGAKPHKCKYCEKSFGRLYNLQRHEIIHTGAGAYKCEYCNKSYNQFCYLKQHRVIHNRARPHKCKYCEKSFSHSTSLIHHEHIHTGTNLHKCQYCEKKFSRSDHLIRHENTHTNTRPYECKHCKTSFIQLTSLKRHENKHTCARQHK